MSDSRSTVRRLDVAEAMFKLGLLSPLDLRASARDVLSEEVDTPSLRQLATLDENDRDAEKLFEQALLELGRTPIPIRDAALLYARWICARILSGEVTPYEGAKAIWRVSIEFTDNPMSELDPFIYAASEWEDRPEDRPFFDKAIKKEARRLTA